MDPEAGVNGDCLGPSDGGWGAAEGRGLGVTPEHLGPSLGAIQYSRTPGTATEAPGLPGAHGLCTQLITQRGGFLGL